MASKGCNLEAYDITLYHMRKVRSTRVVWLLHEMNVADKVKIEKLNLLRGDQNKPEFRAINKLGALPTLTTKEKDGDKSMVMTESAGICLWLADMVPESGLKPDVSNTFGLGQYYRFITLAASTMDLLLWDIRKHEQLLPETMRVQRIADNARQNLIQNIFPTLEDVFKADDGVEFVCEPYHKGISTADVMVGYSLYWSASYGLLNDSPILKKYLARVTQRKEFRRATEDPVSL